MIRDVLLNQMPLVLRKEVYFSASVIGATCGLVVYKSVNSLQMAAVCATIITFTIRLAAIRYSWSIPILRNFGERKK